MFRQKRNLILDSAKVDNLKPIIERLIKEGKVKESTVHKPGKKYVKYKGMRIYFENENSPLKIEGIYKRKGIIARCFDELWRFAEMVWYYRYHPYIFSLLTYFAICGAIATIPQESKIRFYEKIVSHFVGREVKYLQDGRFSFFESRKRDDGTYEKVEYIVDPIGWLLFNQKNETIRYRESPYGTEWNRFEFDDGKIIFIKDVENKGEVYNATLRPNEIRWEEPVGSQKNIAAQKINRREEPFLSDVRKE